MSAATPPTMHRFAGFSLDLIRGVLLSPKGREIPLRPKSFALLQLFVENANRLITRDQILRTLWPDVTVGDEGINQCVSDIRRALADQKQSILRTVRRRGYIFSAASDRRLQSPDLHRTSTGAPLRDGVNAKSKTAVIVLPFENLSRNQSDSLLCLGIAEDLTTDLARLSRVSVVDRSIALSHYTQLAGTKQVRHEIDVHYLVDGSLRRIGRRLRISARLVNRKTGAVLCADRFEWSDLDLEQTYDQVVRRLVRLLKRALIFAEAGAIRQRGNSRESAFSDLATEGWAWYYRPHTWSSRRSARRAFEQALRIDPSSIDARIGLAVVLGQILLDGHSEATQQDELLIEELLLPVYETGEETSMAHIAMGNLRFYQVRLAAARTEFEAALVQDESNEYALRRLGTTLLFMGLPEAAIPRLEETIRLNPDDPNLWGSYWPLGQCNLLLGRADESVELFRRAVAARPNVSFLKLNLSAALGFRGDIAEAKGTLEEAIRLNPSVNSLEKYRTKTPWIANPSHWPSRDKTFNLGLRNAGLPEV